MKGAFEAVPNSVLELSLGLTGILALWMGIPATIGRTKGGMIHILARMVSPCLPVYFRKYPKNHPAIGSMMDDFFQPYAGT